MGFRMILAINSGMGSSVGLFENGQAIIGLEEERFLREKNYIGFPYKALDHILKAFEPAEKIKSISPS